MTRGIAAAAAGLLAAGGAVAQTPPTTPSTPSLLSPFFSTGTPVGRPVLSPVGTAPGAAPPRAGSPIGYRGADGQPVDPGTRPPGKVIDLTNLAAPLTSPLPPGLAGTQPKSALEKAYDKWRELIGLGRPGGTPPSTYTPGLSRRNRERREAAWRRD